MNYKHLLSFLAFIIGVFLLFMAFTGQVTIPGEKTYTDNPSYFNESLYDDAVMFIGAIAATFALWFSLGAFVKNGLIRIVITVVISVLIAVSFPMLNFLLFF